PPGIERALKSVDTNSRGLGKPGEKELGLIPSLLCRGSPHVVPFTSFPNNRRLHTGSYSIMRRLCLASLSVGSQSSKTNPVGYLFRTAESLCCKACDNEACMLSVSPI